MSRRAKIIIWIGVVGIIFLLVSFSRITGIIEKWLWMRQVGYAEIFWKILFIEWALFGIAFIFVFLCFWGNISLIGRWFPSLDRPVICSEESYTEM